MSSKFMQTFNSQLNQADKIQTQTNQNAALDQSGDSSIYTDAKRVEIPQTDTDVNAPTAVPADASAQFGGGVVFLARVHTPRKGRRALPIRAQNAELAGAQFLRTYAAQHPDQKKGSISYQVQPLRGGAVAHFTGSWEPIRKQNAVLQELGLFQQNGGGIHPLPNEKGQLQKPKRFFTQNMLLGSGCGCA
jgi:hypothetical protein